MTKIVPFAPQEMSLLRDLDEVIQEHVERVAQFQRDRETPVVSPEAVDLLLRTMISLLSEIIFEGRGRKWALVGENCFGIGGCIDIEEAKTEARAKFLIFESRFGLFLALDRAPFIGRARDSFWADITSLGNLGQLAFSPYAIPKSLWNRKGKVPIRPGHAVGELMRYWNLLREDGDSLVDFGELQVSWPLGTPLEKLLPAMDETLETFYRIAYELYRLERQSSKRE
jgi:hypothetical protein